MEKTRLIFITGGARSGKSSFAEKYAASLAEKEKRKLYYLATASQSDDEMMNRINRHKEERKVSGFHWETVECPTRLDSKINSFSRHSVVLLDCLTVLLANELYQEGFYEEKWSKKDIKSKVTNPIMEGIDGLLCHVNVLVIVSNEVVYDPMTKEESLVQTYCKMLGLLHQYVVGKSVEAYVVEMGIPLLMKGEDR